MTTGIVAMKALWSMCRIQVLLLVFNKVWNINTRASPLHMAGQHNSPRRGNSSGRPISVRVRLILNRMIVGLTFLLSLLLQSCGDYWREWVNITFPNSQLSFFEIFSHIFLKVYLLEEFFPLKECTLIWKIP